MALPDSPPAPEPVRASRKARLPRWLLVGVGVLAVLVAAGWWTQRPLARIPLPDGGELRLVKAHYGPEFHLERHIGFWRRLQQKYLPGHEEDPDSFSDPFLRDTFHGGMPGGPSVLWLVFEAKGSESGALDHSSIREIVALDSQVMTCTSTISEINGDHVGSRRYIASLEIYPRRAKQLHLRIVTEDRTIEATIPNPFPLTDAPAWTPEPLPQSCKLQSGELILGGLHLTMLNIREGSLPLTGPFITPEFEVRDGDAPQNAFRFESDFADAAGNRSYERLPLSEPVWKIHTIIQRNEFYPFPIAEGTSLGHVIMPGAGEFRVFPLPGDEATDPKRFALIAGPGKYQVSWDGKPQVKPLALSAPTPDHSAVIVQCEKPVCRFFNDSNLTREYIPPRVIRAISPTGEVVIQRNFRLEALDGEGDEGNHEFPSSPPPPGTELDFRYIIPRAESVNFYVRPPR